MRSVYVNQKIITQAKLRRIKLWLSLIPLSPVLLIVVLDQDPEKFTSYTGLTFWQGLAIVIPFALAGIWYARKVWRCPVCNEYLGSDILTKFCPHCASYVAIPGSVSPVYTDDEQLYRGAALLPTEEFVAMEADEKQKSLIRRYRRQIIFSIAFTALFAGLAIMSDIQAERVQNRFQFGFATVRMIILTTGATFAFTWSAIFLFYFDDWLLARYSNEFTKVLMKIYGMDIIKVAFTLLGGMLLTVITFGLFGLWVFFRTRSNLKLLTSPHPAKELV